MENGLSSKLDSVHCLCQTVQIIGHYFLLCPLCMKVVSVCLLLSLVRRQQEKKEELDLLGKGQKVVSKLESNGQGKVKE